MEEKILLIELPDGSSQKIVVKKDARFPKIGWFGFGNIEIPSWVLDKFKGERLQHIVIHEKGHIRDRYLRLLSIIPWFGIVVFSAQSIFNNFIATWAAAIIFALPFIWFFENSADKYAANYVGVSKQAYADTLKGYRVALEQKHGKFIAFIIGLLHLPGFREKLL